MPATNERLWGLLHLCAEIQCRKRKTVKAHQTVWKWKETKQFRGEIVAEAVNGQTLSPIKLGVSGKGRFMQMLCFRMKACVLVVHCEIVSKVSKYCVCHNKIILSTSRQPYDCNFRKFITFRLAFADGDDMSKICFNINL